METPSPSNRKLRVLYSFPDTLGAPGIGTTAFHQVRGLIDRGHEVSVYCTYLGRPLAGARAVVETLSLAGRRVPHRAIGRERAYRRHDARVARALGERAASFDIVHNWPRATTQTAAAAGRAGVASVRELPNAHTGYAYDVVARELESLGLEPQRSHSHTHDARALELEEEEFRSVDLLAAPSLFVRRTFLDRGFSPDSIGLHQYGFEQERFPVPTRPPRPRSGLRALFLGRCEPRKGLHYALQAWLASGAADQGRLTVVGEFYPGYREVLPELAHPSVDVHAFTSDPGSIMRDHDVLVLPSIEEGSALVTYEAQASGCALLVSDAAGAVCEHENQGLIHPVGDVATLTDHLRRLGEDEALLDELRRGAFAQRDVLTWDHAGTVLERLYAALLARRAQS